MRAMIFAAGLGTRMKPLTDSLPKALLPFGDGTLLSGVIEHLKRCGVDDFVINVHHFAPMIQEYLREHNFFDVPFAVSREEKMPLETGGGIKKAQPFLEGKGRFLVHNVDILSNLDIPTLLASAPKNAMSTLVVSERKTNRYLLFDDSMRLCGWTNVSTGEVRSPYGDLKVEQCRKFAFGGIHLMSDEIFAPMAAWPEAFSIIDFYLKECMEHPIYGYVQEGLDLVDVGKMDTYLSNR